MLVFGDPYWVFAWVCFYVVIFGVIGVVGYIVLTRATAISATLRRGGGKSLLPLSRRTALCLIVPAWLIASLWVYQDRLASKYHTLQRVESANGVVWELSYFQPHRLFHASRVISVPEEHIAQWGASEDWQSTFPQPVLVLVLRDGQTYRSLPRLAKKFHAEFIEPLRVWGIEVQKLRR
jgi:hypothetical protein